MLICVTNRTLCKDDFLMRLDQIAQAKPQAILLREKDLSIVNYQRLATSVREICLNNQVPLIIHQHIEVAAALKCPAIHLSMPDFKKYKHQLKRFSQRGASIHTVSEAKEAQQLGATYLIAGHIFSTECKKGIPPRGLPFLQEVCASVTIPVFAIGGITKDKVKEVIDAGAQGICVMSEAMTCCQPGELTDSFSV